MLFQTAGAVRVPAVFFVAMFISEIFYSIQGEGVLTGVPNFSGQGQALMAASEPGAGAGDGDA